MLKMQLIQLLELVNRLLIQLLKQHLRNCLELRLCLLPHHHQLQVEVAQVGDQVQGPPLYVLR